MLSRIKMGDRVEISFKGTKDENLRKLATSVEAVFSNNGEVLVLMPISAGTMVKLPMDKDFEVRFYTGASVIVYDAKIIGHPVIDGLHLTKLRLTSEGERIQLRDYYRIDNTLEFYFSVGGAQLLREDAEFKLYKAVTKDLSAGGMSFVTDKELLDDTEIYANFVLGEDYVVVLARAMGKQDAGKGPYKYLYRSQFLAMPASDQEKIMKYINKQQYKTM